LPHRHFIRLPVAMQILLLPLLWHVASAATPLTKVIELLDDMMVKADKEKKAEATRFSAFDQWCDDQTRIKNNEIAAATEKIAMLAAKIEKAEAAIRRNTDRIEELEEDVGRWARDTKAATEVRGREASDYSATSADYAESLEALDGALATLKSKANKIQQAEVLLQVSKLRAIPESARSVFAAYLESDSAPSPMAAPTAPPAPAPPAGTVKEMPKDNLFHEAPEAYGYEFQSGGVVDILEKLKDEFSTKKYELDHEELSAQHAFEDIAQMLNDNTENANHEIQKKTERRAQLQKEKAEMEEEKAQTESDRAEDQKYLDETKALCAQKTQDFNSRQKLRAGELEALGQAIGILRGDTVTTGEAHLPQDQSFIQRSPLAAFVQLGNGQESQVRQILQTRVAAFLADRAKTCNSRLLLLASQGVGSNPFVKVKKMIKDMISKLTQEATAETEHKGWCDTELTTNKQTRDRKTEQVDELTAEKEDQTSTIAQLTQEIEDLTNEIQELEKAMAEAEAIRAANKEKNEQTIADAKAAQAAVEQATAVLRDFYAKSSQATALTQQTPAEDAPETFDKPYKGLMTESGSIVDFMEVILSDFVRLESETASAEETEVNEHKKFMFEAEKDKALKENSKGHKTDKKKETETALAATEEELKLTQSQLDKAIEYYEKLKPTCVDSGITYEERVKRREDEIQSLQEALKILTGTDVDLS